MSLPDDETTVRVGGEVVRHRRDPWTTVLDAGYRRVVGPALFALDGANAERAHERTLAGLQRLGARPALCRLAGALLGGPRDPVTLADITFPGRVGLAAGMDKNAVGLHAWPALGFGHVELGTVTARPQPGNDRPRLFRLRDSTAVINRMGFNNDGSEAMAHRLCAAGVWRGNNRLGIPVGVSIGKSKSTPLAEAPADYLTSLRRLAPHADYLAINVSSPNTPGLRSLQDATALREVVTTLVDEARRLAGNEAPVPLFVKIAPDLTFPAIDELLAVCLESGVSGLIATNTTLARDRIAYRDLEAAPLAGGLSGAPLLRRALEVVAYVARRSTLPLIGVGGITTPDDARRMMDAGAAMVQVFTGLVYRGPGLVRGINRL